jgi:hypothetical protein
MRVLCTIWRAEMRRCGPQTSLSLSGNRDALRAPGYRAGKQTNTSGMKGATRWHSFDRKERKVVMARKIAAIPARMAALFAESIQFNQ